MSKAVRLGSGKKVTQNKIEYPIQRIIFIYMDDCTTLNGARHILYWFASCKAL